MISIVVGNKGSFFNELKLSCHSLFCSDIFFFEISKPKKIIELLDEINEVIGSDCINFIYIGGETRDDLAMHYYNFQLPVHIVEAFSDRIKKIIYLSSMSVFEGRGIFSLDSPPLTNYGYTKWLFDKYINESSIKYIRLYPASIITENRLGGIGTYSSILKRFKVLNYIEFRGEFSYVYRDDVVSKIVESMLCSGCNEEYILANFQPSLSLQEKRLFRFKLVIPKVLIKVIGFFKPSIAVKLSILNGDYVTPKLIPIISGKKL